MTSMSVVYQKFRVLYAINEDLDLSARMLDLDLGWVAESLATVDKLASLFNCIIL